MEKKSDPAATGILPFDDAAGRIDPHATLASFDADPLAHRCTQRLYGDWTEFVLRHTRIAGQLFIITWRFEKQSLPGIELFLEQPDDGTSWADWSEEKEQRRKLAAEHWTMKAFSRELIVKPYIMEDGTTVTPFEITWQTVRHCKFPWGEIVSFFDAKGGSSGLMLKAKK